MHGETTVSPTVQVASAETKTLERRRNQEIRPSLAKYPMTMTD